MSTQGFTNARRSQGYDSPEHPYVHPRMRLAALGAVLVALGFAQPAHAVSITVSFTGEVTQVQTNDASRYNVAVGDEVRGSYTYQYPQSPSDPNGAYASYLADSMITYFGSGTDRQAYCIGGLMAAGHLSINNDSGGSDRYARVCGQYIGSVQEVGITNDFIDDSSLSLVLTDPTMQAFQSNALPQDAPDLALFADRSFTIIFSTTPNGSQFFYAGISIRLDSMVIPESSSGALLLLGCSATAIVAAARRRPTRGWRLSGGVR